MTGVQTCALPIYNLLIIPLLFITLFTSCFKDGDDVKYTDNNDYNQEVPNGDYIQGKTKTELKTAWNKKLSDTYIHSSYSQVWQAYYTTDIRNDGYVDDIYGGPTTKYTVGADQQTGSTTKGKYNREHTFPKSWFGTQDQNYDMYTDLYHVLPCDYEANEARWNYPYGEVKTENWSNGYCKRGISRIIIRNGRKATD